MISQESAHWPHVLDTILDCSGRTLQQLSIANSCLVAGDYIHWDANDIEYLVAKAPNLRSLAIELASHHDWIYGDRQYDCSLVSAQLSLLVRVCKC